MLPPVFCVFDRAKIQLFRRSYHKTAFYERDYKKTRDSKDSFTQLMPFCRLYDKDTSLNYAADALGNELMPSSLFYLRIDYIFAK